MKTYTTKIAKNGATLYYSTETGKRIAKETALENERNYILANGTVKERNVEVEETTTEQVAEVETEVQEVSKNFDADIRYEFTGGAGMDTSPNFATATKAAQWIIDFAANHPEYTFTGGRVHDNGNCKRYPFTDADITALNANKAAQEVSTEKVDIKEIIAEGLKQVDFSNVTKFEVGKTYFGATWEGEFNPNGAVIVKKLTVTKITPKTICTVDENGLARRSYYHEAYAGTTQGFVIGTPNGYVDIYAFNEYTPAVAAVPTDNYTVWSEAALAIREGKTPEVNTMNTAAETDGSEDDVEDLLPELDALKIETDTVNEKYMRVRFALYICNHFYLNEVRKVLFPIRDEYYTEAATMIDNAEKLYVKLKAINFDVITRNLKTFEYIRKGISNETYAATESIFEEIRDKLGDKILASELTKLADEFGIDRALLLQSDDCRFNPALFDEKSAEPAPELTETNSLKKLYAEKLEDVMLDKKIAEENRKLDEPAEVKSPPTESFTAKRDKLIAERDAANAKLKEAKEALKAAKLAAFNAGEKFFDFMVDNMHKLNERINLPDAEIEVKTTNGCLAYIALETVRVTFKDTKFILCGDCSVIYGLTLGIYDTPEQVMTAVEQFKAAIERGDKRFDFANPDQNFDKHSLRDSLERAMKIALERHAEFCHAGKLSDAEDEMKLYAIYAQAMKELGKGVGE